MQGKIWSVTLSDSQSPERGAGAYAIEQDRWGRVLLQLRDAGIPPERFPGQWSLPGGMLLPGEAPDATAFRKFEEETGHLLESLRLFRVYHRDAGLPAALADVQHVYYVDVNEGQAFRYFAPAETETLTMPPHTRTILGDFFSSPADRTLFH